MSAISQVQAMDRMYRHQRFIYDLTRKYYLLGRDRLLRMIDVHPGDAILEIGCGTGRNLLQLVKYNRNVDARYYGLDASHEMLATARKQVIRLGGPPIRLEQCLAERLDYRTTFERTQPFDTIFFSYALSMIPGWRDALEAALANLRPGGDLYIVDFWDQAALPEAFRRLLQWWLRQFHVRHEPGVMGFLHGVAASGGGVLSLTPVYRRYAYLAALHNIRVPQ